MFIFFYLKINRSTFKICYKCVSKRTTVKTIFISFTEKEMPFDTLTEKISILGMKNLDVTIQQ